MKGAIREKKTRHAKNIYINKHYIQQYMSTHYDGFGWHNIGIKPTITMCEWIPTNISFKATHDCHMPS